jgi:hypothetical protein
VNDLDLASSTRPILSYVNTWVHNHLPLREPEAFGTEDHGDADCHLCRDFVFGRTGRASESVKRRSMVNKPEGKCTSEPLLLPVSCYHIAGQTLELSSPSHEFLFHRCLQWILPRSRRMKVRNLAMMFSSSAALAYLFFQNGWIAASSRSSGREVMTKR